MSSRNQITTDTEDDVTVLRLRGEIDMALRPQASRALHRVVAAGRPVVADLGAVTFLDSSGVAFLLQCLRACREAELPYALRAVPASVSQLLAVLGLDDVLPVVTATPAGAAGSASTVGAASTAGAR
jgi:anti-anti-sigma factor